MHEELFHMERCKKHYRWLKVISDSLKSLFDAVEALENENSALKDKVSKLRPIVAISVF